MKYEDCVLKPRPSEEIQHHDSSVMNKTGQSYVLLDDIHYDGAGIRVTTRHIDDVPEDMPDYVELHTHDVDQVFIFLDEPGNKNPLQAEITLEDEKYIVTAPVSVFIPKEVPHSQRVIKGTGRMVTILKKGKYP